MIFFFECMVIHKTGGAEKINGEIKKAVSLWVDYVAGSKTKHCPSRQQKKTTQFPIFYEVAANNLRPSQPVPSTAQHAEYNQPSYMHV